MSGGLHIGITIGLQQAGETLWNNGIKQNAAFLALALARCANVASVRLVNTTDVSLDGLPWDIARWPTVPFEAAKDSVDVLIELGGQIGAAQTDYLKARGARLVSYCCTTEYVMAMESVLFSKRLWGPNLFINPRYDDIWLIPQVAHLSAGYFSLLRRQRTQVVPFVWDPVLLEQRAAALPEGGRYRPHAGPRRLTVLEPNINVVKFCLYPAFIAEEAYRQRPESIALLQVTNAERIARESEEFIALMNQLDIVRGHKAVFLGRFDTPQFLADSTDIVVSHQLENALNYLYLEVCWQGYALVHNADLCTEVGYFYAGHDVQAGATRLLEATDRHDADSGYMARQRSAIERFRPHDATLVSRYTALLDELMQRPIR